MKIKCHVFQVFQFYLLHKIANNSELHHMNSASSLKNFVTTSKKFPTLTSNVNQYCIPLKNSHFRLTSSDTLFQVEMNQTSSPSFVYRLYYLIAKNIPLLIYYLTI